MKTFSITTIIAAILFICNTGIQAQNKPTNSAITNQFELIKPLHSNLPPEIKQSFDENKPQLPQGFENLQNPEIRKAEKVNRLKSATADGQQLDSVITETWIDSLDQWEPMMKEEFLYNENGNKTFSGNSGWDKANKQWSQYITQYIYDSNGNMTESYFHVWWFSECNHQTTYDSMGNITLIVWYNRPFGSTGQWNVSPKSKIEYNYNANGKITLRLEYGWHNSRWITIYKDETTYDTNGNIISIFGYNWDSYTSTWVNSHKTKYSYNTDGNQAIYLSYQLSYQWNVFSSQWSDPDEMVVTSLDTNGNITSIANYKWDSAKRQWIGGVSEEWTYDTNGNIISHLISNYKEEFTYDANGNKTLKISYRWDASIADWVVSSKSTYYYSDHTTTFFPNTSANKLTVYPNPAKDFVVFDLPNRSESATAELYDIQGKKVVQQKLTGIKQISVGQLPKGLYLYRLTDSEIFYTGKLVVE